MTPADPSRFGQVHYATDGRDILWNDPDGWEVDQPWLWYDGPADGSPGPWGNPPPGAEHGAPSMRGTSLPAVTRCISLIADKIASMPWKTYRDREQLVSPGWIVDPQAARRDGRTRAADVPGVRFSNVEFWQQYLTSYLLCGEGIAYTPRVLDEAGEPTGEIIAPIYVINPAHVELNDDGEYVVDDDGDEIVIDSRELIVTRNIVRPGHRRGLGVIQAHAADLGFIADTRTYLDNMFSRGVPNGYLKSSKPDLDATAARNLKDAWMAAHGGTRKSIAVLNATTEFKPLTIDMQTAQMVDMLRLQAWQVCLMFGVPPSKLGISMGSSLTYSNLESENVAFVNDALMNPARKIEAAIDPVLPAGTELKIDFNQLLRGDTITRYDAYKVGLDAGFLTVDEVRGFEDLPPLSSPVAPPSLALESPPGVEAPLALPAGLRPVTRT
jgi:HK97 family phage portal protein